MPSNSTIVAVPSGEIWSSGERTGRGMSIFAVVAKTWRIRKERAGRMMDGNGSGGGMYGEI